MSALVVDVKAILLKLLPNFDNDDVFVYLLNVVDGMSVEERRNCATLQEVISPFLVDAGYSDSEEKANEICRNMAISFGWSGYTKKGGGVGGGGGGGASSSDSSNSSSSSSISDEVPQLLAAPLKMAEQSAALLTKKQTYGGAVLAADSTSSDSLTLLSDDASRSNSAFDAGAIETFLQSRATKLYISHIAATRFGGR